MRGVTSLTKSITKRTEPPQGPILAPNPKPNHIHAHPIPHQTTKTPPTKRTSELNHYWTKRGAANYGEMRTEESDHGEARPARVGKTDGGGGKIATLAIASEGARVCRKGRECDECDGYGEVMNLRRGDSKRRDSMVPRATIRGPRRTRAGLPSRDHHSSTNQLKWASVVWTTFFTYVSSSGSYFPSFILPILFVVGLGLVTKSYKGSLNP